MLSYTYTGICIFVHQSVRIFHSGADSNYLRAFYNFAIDIEIVVNQIKLFIYLFSLFIFKTREKKLFRLYERCYRKSKF